MVAVASALFWVAVTVATSIILTLLVTLTTRIRLWPPGDDDKKAVFHWGLVGIFDFSIVSIAVLQWDSWILARPSSLIVGLVLSGLGGAIFLKSSQAMSTAETSGQVADELHTEGLYARSRNPQYLGMMVGLVGFALLANSLSVVLLCVLHVCWLVLLPFTEEPWLRDQFGKEYERYCAQVPRFVGYQTVRPSKSGQHRI